jgi:hypothetical protein
MIEKALEAVTNFEHTGDRDLAHSDLMRRPGTHPNDQKSRRPGFNYLRSYDRDVAPLCDICGLEILSWDVTRDLYGDRRSERYTLALAAKLGVEAFQIKKIDHDWQFKCRIESLHTRKKWEFDAKEGFIQWVERQYWEHLRKVHGYALSSNPPSLYGE